MKRPLDLIFIGLSFSSSWGNGHATTYRGLLRALWRQGHRIRFLERDKPWYASHRDLPSPEFCELDYYGSIGEVQSLHAETVRSADAVIIGSYVPEGIELIDAVLELRDHGVFFYDIDTPVTLAKLKAGDTEYLAARQIPAFDTYFSFAGGPTLRRIEREFGARRADALYCAVDPEAYTNTGEAIRWDLGYLGTYSIDRQPKLERLLIEPARKLPHLRFVVAGSQYPADIEWPANVERIEHVPPSAHPSFYSRQRFTLNVTRADMILAGWSPSIRLFEAAACRTPIISDVWAGLGELFPPGKALYAAKTAEDVTFLLMDEPSAARSRVADTAFARVMREHTTEARARQFVTRLEQVLERRTAAEPLEFVK